MFLRFMFFLAILIGCGTCLLNTNANAEETTTTVITPATPVSSDQATTTTVVNTDGTQETKTTTVNADGTIQKETIITKTPEPQEVITAPAGYQSCETIAAGWYNDVWVPEHQVCKYTASTEGAAWVGGYWACMKHRAGECVDWKWRSGHWVKTYEVY